MFNTENEKGHIAFEGISRTITCSFGIVCSDKILREIFIFAYFCQYKRSRNCKCINGVEMR